MDDESRRKWLISISDLDSERLEPADRYDRIRYIRFEESQRFLTEQRLKPSPHWNREWKPYKEAIENGNASNTNNGYKQAAIAQADCHPQQDTAPAKT